MPAPPLAARRPELLLAGILSVSLAALSLQVRRPDGRSTGERWLLSSAAPLVRGVAEARSAVSDAAARVRTRQELADENHLLRARVAELEGEALRLRDAERERERLLELLGTRPDPPPGTRAARLIAIDAAGPFRSGLLDRGTADGIAAGAVVVAKDGLVGRVIEAGARTARVQLLSDRAAGAGVLVAGGKRTAVARGDGAGAVAVQFVPILFEGELPAGDLVVTSGTDGLYPRDLPVGRIASVKREPGTLFLKISLSLAADPSRQSLVFVLPPLPHPETPAPSLPVPTAAPPPPAGKDG